MAGGSSPNPPIPGGNIDWTTGNTKATTAATQPPASAPGLPPGVRSGALPGGNIDWSGAGNPGTPAATKAATSGKNRGLLSRIGHDIVAAPGAAVRGTVERVLPGASGKKVAADINTGAGGVVHLPGALVTDAATFARSAAGGNRIAADALMPALAIPGLANHLHTNENATQQPGESMSEFTARKYPLLGGALVQGPVTLFEHAAHPTQAAKDYGAHPILGPLGDLATAAMFTGPLAKGLGVAAEGQSAAAEAARAGAAGAEATDAAGGVSRAAAGAEGSPAAVSTVAAPAPPVTPPTSPTMLGRAAQAADVLHGTVENLANPLRPLSNGVGPIPGLRNIPVAAFDRAQQAAAEGEVPGRLTSLLAKLAPQMHDVSGKILEGQANEAQATEAQTRLGKALTKVLPDREEQQAATVIGERTAPALSAVRKSLGTEGFDQYVADRYKGTLTPKAANLAADVADGLNPDFAAKADEFLRTYDQYAGGQGERTAAFMANPAHDWQGGYEPNPTAVAEATDKAGAGMSRAERQATVARARAERAAADLKTPADAQVDTRAARLTKAIDRARVLGNIADQAETRLGKLQGAAEAAGRQAEYTLENAPSRLRPVLGENRAAAKVVLGAINDLRGRGLTDSAGDLERALERLPTDLKGLEAQGIDAQHFFHTQELRPGKGGGARAINLPRTFTAGSEKLRTGSPVYDRGVSGQIKGGVEALKAETRRATVAEIDKLPNVTAKLNEGPLDGVRTAEEAAARGYVPWSPSTMFDTQGRVRSVPEIDAQLGLTGDTRFIPKPIFDEFRNYFEPRRGQVLGLVMDPLNRVSILGKLAFSPSFIIGRIFGHGMLALAGTSDPVAFGQNLLKVTHDYFASGSPGERSFERIPGRVLKSNAAGAEYSRLVNDATKDAGKTTRLGQISDTISGGRLGGASAKLSELGNAAISKPFKLAGFFDNVQRSAFYLTEAGTKAPEAALEATLRATGEFDRMTPFERDYVRRIIPFWAWHRELTRIAFHLAEDHPLRVAWTLHLANLASKPDTSLPEQYQQGFKVGGTVVDASYLNPFNEVGATGGGGLLGIGKILGPGAAIAAGSLTGEKPSTGRPFTRPAGTGKDNGNVPTAPSLAHQFSTFIPQLKVLNGLTGQSAVKRYDTGQIKLDTKTGRPIVNPTGGKLTSLTNFLGLPAANVKEQQAIQKVNAAAAAKSAATAKKQKANYNKKAQAAKR